MIKRTASRNHRPKGIKLKHVLQIILLLGVCFWLVYQIKHSHDKKKEFDENDAKESVRLQNIDHIQKLGRKDLQPLKDDIIQTEQHEEKEEDENNLDDEGNVHGHDEQEEGGGKHETGENLDKSEIREQDEEEEESKHGAEEQDDEENKSEESEDDGRGGGDEEIEENDQEKPEVDIDHEELMDEGREREKEESDEKENENGEDEEKDSSVEDKSTHEAREEQYMADDASSAVAHDAQTTNTESVILSADHSDENSEISIVKQENKPNNPEESSRNQNDSGKITADALESGNVSNATSKEIGNTDLSNSVDNSNVNTTATANSDGHLEVSGNHSVVITEAINNSTGDGINTPGSSEQNKTEILSESENSQNTTVDMTANDGVKNGKTEELEKSHANREENLPTTNSMVFMSTGNAGESSDSGAGQSDKTTNHVASNETQNNSINSDTKENIDPFVDEKSKVHSEVAATNVTQNSSDGEKDEKSVDDTQLDSSNRTSDSSSMNGGASDLVEQDAIDASDSNIHKDVTEVRTDLETLPDMRDDETNIFDEHALTDIRNEGNILDETAVE